MLLRPAVASSPHQNAKRKFSGKRHSHLCGLLPAVTLADVTGSERSYMLCGIEVRSETACRAREKPLPIRDDALRNRYHKSCRTASFSGYAHGTCHAARGATPRERYTRTGTCLACCKQVSLYRCANGFLSLATWQPWTFSQSRLRQLVIALILERSTPFRRMQSGSKPPRIRAMDLDRTLAKSTTKLEICDAPRATAISQWFVKPSDSR